MSTLETKRTRRTRTSFADNSSWSVLRYRFPITNGTTIRPVWVSNVMLGGSLSLGHTELPVLPGPFPDRPCTPSVCVRVGPYKVRRKSVMVLDGPWWSLMVRSDPGMTPVVLNMFKTTVLVRGEP